MEDLIVERLVMGAFQTNSYLVGCPETRQAMVIDPAAEDVSPILERLEALDLSLILALNTHGHYDHILGSAALVRQTGVPLAVHEQDAPRLHDARYDVSYLLGLRRERVEPTRLLRDGDEVEVGSLTFTVLHTPGHTPGGICLLGHGVLFSGDTLFNLGIGRTDLPGGDMHRLIHSLENVLLPLDDDLVVYPGHGPHTTLGYEKRNNPFL